MSRVWFVLASVALSSSAMASLPMAGGIPMPVYGSDNRQDLYQVTDPLLLKLADSTVSIFIGPPLTLQLDSTRRNYSIPQANLQEQMNACPDEPFSLQPAAANCSGALVGPDLVLTAGHCVTNEFGGGDNCANLQIAFGFALKHEGVNPKTLPKSEVYKCKSIVAFKQEESSNGSDYAVIRLDRKVTHHKPLAIDRTDSVGVGEPLVVIGHPSGLPEKVAGGAKVLNVSDPHKFVANLDTYAGNSGSPVFDAQTGVIVGILVTGEQDFVPQNPNDPTSCMVSKRCADDASDCGAMPDGIGAPTGNTNPDGGVSGPQGVPGERSNRAAEAAQFIPELSQ